jgi:cytochrome c biogenesis protein CcdA/thiol-disulfide isomerase/thioredoxin
MIIQILFAVLAGVLTIAAPCILPMLPILLGASVGYQNKQRPLLIVLGFIISFSAAALLLSDLIGRFNFSPNLLRDIAAIALGIFGLLLIWPKPFELLAAKMSEITKKAGQIGGGRGSFSGLILGLVLGIIWTPCAGPILGSILTLVATQGSTARSATLMVAYALGAGIPMLVIAYGSQWITTRVRSIAKYSQRLEQLFGVLILLLAVAMYFQYDITIENTLTQAFPQSSLENQLVKNSNPIINNSRSGTTTPQSTADQVTLQNYGAAPDFTGIARWLNLPAGQQSLSLSQLKGKVVLVDFWTFSCINCIRTLPYVTHWYDTYKDKGFVVIGVHTPEFAFEKDTGNVAAAIQRFNIRYPVAQDNNYGTWSAYNNEYWPAEYLIDQNGNIVHEHFGEGEYDVTENAIRQLLGLNDESGLQTSLLGNIQSPEMYFEPSRLENLTPDQKTSVQPQTYSFTQNLALNNFALSGTWQFLNDHAQLVKLGGGIRLKFSSGKVYMVAAADHPVTLHITVDGAAQPNVTVQASQLYTLFNSNDYSEHTIDIEIPDPGFEAFTFTFG